MTVKRVNIGNLEGMVLDHLPVRIFWKDRNSVYLGCNLAFATDAKVGSPDKIVGKTDFDLPWGQTEANLYREDDSNVMETGIAKLNYEEPQRQSGGKTWLCTSKIPLVDDAGNVVGVVGTYEDITQRKLTEFELINMREKADAANLAKTEFLGRMSHDLRTPLNAILGNAELMMLDPDLPLEQRSSLLEIQQSGDDLYRLVAGLLEMSQIESGQGEIRIESCPLVETLQHLLQQFATQAEVKDLGLQLRLGTGLPVAIQTDLLKLRRVLGNFVSNAVKFSSQGQIILSADAVEHGVEFAVSDMGIGIPSNVLQAIFAPFTQLNGKTSAEDGVGLGLAICKRFVTMLGGEIRVESTPNVGSKFSFILPHHHAANGENVAPIERFDSPSMNVDGPMDYSVLIVDDNVSNRDLLRRFFKRQGKKTFEATNGAEAVVHCAEFKPEVVLMDIRMPVLDGIEATRQIRDGSSDQPVIIALSGEAFDQHQEAAAEAGCDAYLVKPVSLKLLQETIAGFIH